MLIDLSLCPELLINDLYIRRAMVQELVFDKRRLLALTEELKIFGLVQEYDRICLPLRDLGKIELTNDATPS